MKLLITEVTEMHGGNYCVAGWRQATGEMVRPLPTGHNWTAPLLAQYGIVPGATIRATRLVMAVHGNYPHRSEDTPVEEASLRLIGVGPEPWFGANAPPVSTTLAEAFEGHLKANSAYQGVQNGIYVTAGVQTRSLWAVAIRRNNLTFVVDFGKLKGIVDDGALKYKLAVSSRVLKEAWNDGGLVAVNRALPRSHLLHVRVGLARAFGNQADKCYVMINGVYG